ncbi:MAG: ribosome recycling factor [Endomicrobiia bacterium]
MPEAILQNAESLMKKTIEKLKQEISSIRTGKASPALLEEIKVNCYNSIMPLNQVAGITTPDYKTIEIRPWDNSILPEIEKAIYKSSLGLTPTNDGKIIRLTIPPLTEERRQELVKFVNKIGENFRTSIRNDRRQVLEMIKKSYKDKKISEDMKFKLEEKLQKITDEYIKKIDEIISAKEKEIFES